MASGWFVQSRPFSTVTVLRDMASAAGARGEPEAEPAQAPAATPTRAEVEIGALAMQLQGLQVSGGPNVILVDAAPGAGRPREPVPGCQRRGAGRRQPPGGRPPQGRAAAVPSAALAHGQRDTAPAARPRCVQALAPGRDDAGPAYAVWAVPSHPDLRGVHLGAPACWRHIQAHLPDGQYTAGTGTHLRRFDSWQEATVAYGVEAEGHGAPAVRFLRWA